MREATVVEELPLHLVIAGQPGLPMTAELRYDSNDPYAVHATFRAEDSQVTWVLARELMMTGLQAVSGMGDVKIQPCEQNPAAVVLIQLSSPDGVAVLAASSADPRTVWTASSRASWASRPRGTAPRVSASMKWKT